MFPKSTIATIIGIGGLAWWCQLLPDKLSSGRLFDYAAATGMRFLGFEGKPAGYFIIFCICGVAYLVGWLIMITLVPKYKVIEVNGQNIK